MALNPFFLQGSQSEQNLVQQLINEQLKIYGVEVIYIPRKFLKNNTVIKENVLSQFDDNFAIEAYVKNYEGFAGGGDFLTKFGIKSGDELSLVISRERFEDFISPFLNSNEDFGLPIRPREGDLVYFPLSDTIFEIKFVEHEVDFYQLGKLYVYELRCEVFEFEDEKINTGIADVDDNFVENVGYTATLTLASIGSTATAIIPSITASNYSVNQIYLVDDGSGFTSVPTVAISTAPAGGVNATAKAVMRTKYGTTSIDKILITNSGSGYTSVPTVSIVGGGSTLGIATAGISTGSIRSIVLTNSGSNYAITPTVTLSSPGVGVTAVVEAVVSVAGTISELRIVNAGSGYTSVPTVTIGNPALTGIGTYQQLETIVGSSSSARASVINWNAPTKKLKVSIIDKRFSVGETIVGSASSASYTILSVDYDSIDNIEYSENKEIEDAADQLLDFTESNPFGEF